MEKKVYHKRWMAGDVNSDYTYERKLSIIVILVLLYVLNNKACPNFTVIGGLGIYLCYGTASTLVGATDT